MNTNELSIHATGEVAQMNKDAAAIASESSVEPAGAETAVAPWAPVTFKAKQSTGFAKSEEWNITLNEASAVFTKADGGEHIEVVREKATQQIGFSQGLSLMPPKNFTLTHDGESLSFQLDGEGRSHLLSWLPKRSEAELKGELRKWGVGLIVLGGLHFVLKGILDPTWGVVLLIVGGLNMLVSHKAMFILNGICLILVGFMNMAGGGGWKFFGVMQIIWGVQEMRKMSRFE
jgi:hypothetical protein